MMTILTAALGQAADFTAEQYQQFEKCVFQPKADGPALLYRFRKPDVKPGEKYPLIIFLHGAGERGADNDAQLTGQDLFLHLVYSEAGQKNPSFVLVPQCPEGKRWCEVNWSTPDSHTTPAEPSEPFQLLRQLVDKLKKELPIDASRIYITGISMGGFGTFDWIVRYPGEVAAAVPICGGADNQKLAEVPDLKTLPIWIFHGSVDSAVNTERSRNAFKVLKKINPNAKYTEYPGVDHNSWTPAYRTAELAEWLFQQKRELP